MNLEKVEKIIALRNGQFVFSSKEVADLSLTYMNMYVLCQNQTIFIFKKIL